MSKKFIFIALLGLAVGCNRNEDAHHFDNVVYFSGDGHVAEVRVGEDDAAIERSVSVRMALPEDGDVTVSIRADESLLQTYRQNYSDPSASLLPAASYKLSAQSLNITAGTVTSLPVSLSFTGVNALPDLGTHYVLPLVIESAQVKPLESGSVLYYVFSKASLVNMVADINENRAWPSWKDPAPFKDLAQFTLEALVYGVSFKKSGITSPLSTVMGIEDRFLIRVGDTSIPDNQLQIAYATHDADGGVHRNHVSNAQMKLQSGRWYHIAVTFQSGKVLCYLDGKLVGTGDPGEGLGVSAVDFSTEHSEEDNGKPRCFWVGYSYDKARYWNGRIAEARIWNKALTEADINVPNHFYKVDPSSAGLIAYWKFDDGEGSVIKDYSPLGNDLTCQQAPGWYPVSLPEE